MAAPTSPGTILPATRSNSVRSTAESLIPVRDVNWADPNVYRAGIVPVYDDGTRVWVGLGVSSYSSNITSLGGGFEASDHDLLSTAVREYNEEIGDNLDHITEEMLYHCYAIWTPMTILILLPVTQIPAKFTPTSELYTIMWSTPIQLESMSRHEEYKFRNTRIRAYTFGGGLRSIMPLFSTALKNGVPIDNTGINSNWNRPQRIPHIIAPKIVTSIDQLEADIKIPGQFPGYVMTVITPEVIGLASGKTYYIIPISEFDRVIAAVSVLQRTVMVASYPDEPALFNSKLPGRLKGSLEYRMRSQEAAPLKEEFLQKLAQIRADRTDAVVRELALIMEYEEKNYELSERSKQFFIRKRACYLDSVTLVNRILMAGPQNFDAVQYTVASVYKCSDITTLDILLTMYDTGLVWQNEYRELVLP